MGFAWGSVWGSSLLTDERILLNVPAASTGESRATLLPEPVGEASCCSLAVRGGKSQRGAGAVPLVSEEGARMVYAKAQPECCHARTIHGM